MDVVGRRRDQTQRSKKIKNESLIVNHRVIYLSFKYKNLLNLIWSEKAVFLHSSYLLILMTDRFQIVESAPNVWWQIVAQITDSASRFPLWISDSKRSNTYIWKKIKIKFNREKMNSCHKIKILGKSRITKIWKKHSKLNSKLKINKFKALYFSNTAFNVNFSFLRQVSYLVINQGKL